MLWAELFPPFKSAVPPLKDASLVGFVRGIYKILLQFQQEMIEADGLENVGRFHADLHGIDRDMVLESVLFQN